MNRLDKHFENWKPETEMIVVGCSPTLRHYPFGKYIDQFKNVVRINKCFHDGLYEHTGYKIDTWSTTNRYGKEIRWGTNPNSTTWKGNEDDFNPLNDTTKEVWPRLPVTARELESRGTLKDFKGKVVNMRTENKKCVYNSSTFNDFHFKGLGTGMIALNYAIQRFKRITIIGHTFYLESKTPAVLDFDNDVLIEDGVIKSGVEMEGQTRARLNHCEGDRRGIKYLSYIKKWIKNNQMVLLNPYEYDNIRVNWDDIK
tara:strand:- start:1891 stop:2658 length:768 start_codon:yes stop_codon:yes gene_type:complete